MDTTTREMPKYKCHKEVWALKISDIIPDSRIAQLENRETDGSYALKFSDYGYAAIKVNSEYVRKHKPEVGGYYVVYEDGYKSYSPAKPFEDGYTAIN